ncbi:MAG: histidine kinase N-terminal 7TM domain-containing protein [Methanoregula sp.]
MNTLLLFTVLVFTCLISAFITFGLGIFVLARNPASEVNRLFFAMMLGATYWALGEYLLWTASGADGLRFWLKASAFWPLVIAIAIHFILTLTNHPFPQEKRRRYIIALLYIPGLMFSFIGLFTDAIYTVGYESGIGWVYEPAQNPANMISGIYIIAMMFLATYATALSWRHAEKKTRQQTLLISIGLALLLGFGCLSGVVLPYYDIHYPNVVFIGNVFFSLLIVYAIQRHGLFKLSPETAVPYILRTLPDGVVLTDTKGKILVVNEAAAKNLKIPDQAMPGQQIRAFLPEPVCTTIRSALFTKGTIADVEAVLPREEYCVVSIAGTLVRDPSGEIAGIVLIFRDVTDRKSGEIALRMANEKISLLTQMTRHDIGNLMTALSGYLDLIKEKNANPESSAYLSKCTEIVEKISRHLQFSREYQEIGSHQPSWQQLNQLIMQGITTVPYEGIEVRTRIPPVEVYTDPLAFKVMYNLFENAVRHGGNIHRFDVSTVEKPDGTLAVVFEDDGTGVKNEDKCRIFEYGYGSNTGIGLSLSRDILQATGISIAENGTAGKGARFEISVPPGGWRASRGKIW